MTPIANTVYQFTQTKKRFRVLEVCADLEVICVNVGKPTTRLYPVSFEEICNWLDTRRIIPVTLETQAIAWDLRPEAERAQGSKYMAALAGLAGMRPQELMRRKLWPDYRRIAQELGVTPHNVLMLFSKVLQSGMRLDAVVPNWHRCRRRPAVVARVIVKKAVGKQPNSYTMSRADLENIRKGAKRFKVGSATWREAYEEFLKEFYPAGIKDFMGQQIVEVLPPNARPSFWQFMRFAKKLLGFSALKIQEVGLLEFNNSHAGQPIGQSQSALMPGLVTEMDWTTSGVVGVMHKGRLSIGTLTVYIVADRYSGMILAIYVTLGKGCYEEAARALLTCLEDKVELCASVGIKITHEQWPVAHLPVQLYTDRGELNTWLSENIASGLGITLLATRPYMGREKGTVEVANRWLKHKFRRLSGGTMGYKERSKESPHVTAIYDVDQIRRLAYCFAIEYNGRLKKRHPALTAGMIKAGLMKQPTPVAIWSYGSEHGMLRTMPLAEARALALPYKEASITERGIEYQGLVYSLPTIDLGKPSGIDADEWLAKARKERWKVAIGVDYATTSHVWLHHSPPGCATQLIKCELSPRSEAFANFTWSEYLESLKEAKEGQRVYSETFFRDLKAYMASIDRTTTQAAQELTDEMRKGLAKARLTENIAKNRAEEKAAQTAPATPSPEPAADNEMDPDPTSIPTL